MRAAPNTATVAPVHKFAVSRNEAAALLDISPSTFDEWMRRGWMAGELSAVDLVKSPVASVPSNVITARIDKHAMKMDDFAQLPQILHEGTILPDPGGDPRTRSIIWQNGKTWWRAFVRLSTTGHMRVNSPHQRDEAAALKELGRGGGAAGGR